MKKVNRIFGVGLVVVLLVSLFGFAAPASAGTLSWTDETIPDTTGNVSAPGTDVTDIAVSGDSNTIYVTDNESNSLFKSTNGGDTWSQATLPSTAAAPLWVAVAPDDPDVVAFVADGNEVYVSTDGGTNWKTALMTVADTTTSNSSTATASSIFDIDVSVAKSGVNYLAVAGSDSDGEGNVWYYNLGVGGYWHETKNCGGFNSAAVAVATANASAVKFSPNFNSDSVITAVLWSSGLTGGSTYTNVTFQMFSENTKEWNDAAGFGSGYPVTLATDTSTNISGVDAADIALSPTYLGSDDVERIAFIGLALDGTTAGKAKAGVVRLKDTSKKLIADDYQINSVAYDGSILVAGHYDSNYVRYTDEPLATTPTFSAARSLKRPQGTDPVVLAWADGKVLAGTSGNESSFCVSENNGKSFNGISLVDTDIAAIEDVGISADGSKVYMATSDTGSTDLSVWRKDSSWQRILSVTGTTGNGFIVRMAPESADVIYVAKRDAKTIYYTQDAGEEKWFTRSARYNLQDLAVESEDVAYIGIDSSASVSKTTNGGFTWGSSKATNLSGGNIHTITSISEDNVIVGSTSGYVSYSTDGGSNWTRIDKQIESGALLTQVAASGLSDGDYIYCVSSEASATARRWEIGTSASWTDLELDGKISSGYSSYGISLFDGVLYVVSANGSDSEMLVSLSPTVSVPLSGYWSTASSAGEVYNTAPSALKVSASGDNIKLWAINNANGTLYSFTDILAKAGPTLVGPADGKRIGVNSITGYANDVSLTWERPPKGRSYDYNVSIALDSGFTEKLPDQSKTSSSASPNLVLSGSSFNTGTTYYWKVRVAQDGPLKSPWSVTRSFTIEPGAEVVPTVLAPQNGATTTKQKPSFSWSPVSSATKYRFVLANNAELTAPLVDITTASTAYAVTTDLAYGETYYWAVRSIEPIEGSWSAIANFSVMAKPTVAAPPVVVTEVPAPVINIPAAPPAQEIVIPPAPAPAPQIAPAYIWAIIIIGAVLVIAVIVLIVRTRRTSV